MAGSSGGYDYSTNIVSPDGKVVQLEYAQKAVEAGGTAVGVRCSDGVVLGVEKLLTSRLLVKTSNRKIFPADEHVGVAVSGCGPDGRRLGSIAASICRRHRSNFGIPCPPETLAQQLSDIMYAYTSYGAYRPFGAAVLVAGRDGDSGASELYQCEVDGSFLRYFGSAIGKGARAAKTEIEKERLFDKTCREALPEIARIMHTVHDASKDKPFELDLSWCCEESGFQFKKVPEDLRVEADQAGKEAALDADSAGAMDAAAAAIDADADVDADADADEE